MNDGVLRLLAARWVFPITAPPIADGAVVIASGRLAAVGSRRDLTRAFPAAARWDLGEAALLPGLINCHTHLELGAIVSPVPEESFVTWVVRLIEARRAMSPEVLAAAALAAGRAALRTGTTCVGDISSNGESLAPLRSLGLRGVVFREVLGLPAEEAATRALAAREALSAMRGAAGSRLGVGLSPHSPYSLSEELFRACGAILHSERVPCAIHVAESPEEVELLATGGGPILARLYPAVGCVRPPRRERARSPVAYLSAQRALGWRPILVHAVHVDAEDSRLIACSGASVAHCPRSNARLSRGLAPVPEFLRRGIPVGLGTDSLASAPSLSLWDEMRAALAVHAGQLTPKQVLEIATLGGARALGMSDRVGSLEAGKSADLIAVPASPVEAADPVGSLLAGTAGDGVLLSMVEGEVCYSQQEVGP
jgi:cytosine/adenosine deaminase-related metal-dependent hydrolase